jgi:hypothetical protein
MQLQYTCHINFCQYDKSLLRKKVLRQSRGVQREGKIFTPKSEVWTKTPALSPASGLSNAKGVFQAGPYYIIPASIKSEYVPIKA